jgi:hypothetical protein
MIKRMIKPWDAAPSATPCHNDYCGAGTRYSIWRCLADRRDSEQRAPNCKPADNRPLGAGVCRRGGSGRVGRPALRSGRAACCPVE